MSNTRLEDEMKRFEKELSSESKDNPNLEVAFCRGGPAPQCAPIKQPQMMFIPHQLKQRTLPLPMRSQMGYSVGNFPARMGPFVPQGLPQHQPFNNHPMTGFVHPTFTPRNQIESNVRTSSVIVAEPKIHNSTLPVSNSTSTDDQTLKISKDPAMPISAMSTMTSPPIESKVTSASKAPGKATSTKRPSTSQPDSTNGNNKKKKYMRMAAGTVWEDSTLEQWDPDDFRIFCGDLGNDVTDDMLNKVFSKYPSFQKAKVVRDKRTLKTKGFGFASFKSADDFMAAIKDLNGKYVGCRPIKLKKSSWQDRQVENVKKKEKTKKKLGFR